MAQVLFFDIFSDKDPHLNDVEPPGPTNITTMTR